MSIEEDKKQSLFFGIFAWRLGLVDQQQLAIAIREHLAASDQTPLADRMVALNQISENSRENLEQLIAEQLDHHGGNQEQSLASLDGDLSTIDSLLGDTDVANNNSTISRTAGLQLRPVESTISLGEIVGQGGLGRVYRATDDSLNREIAVKRVREEFAESDQAQRRFRREALITGMLQHPGVVSVYGIGIDSDDQPYYSMRLVDGVSLTHQIREFHENQGASPSFDSLEFRSLIDHLVDVAQTIQYAHSQGVLHRDLKPDNVMVGNYGETLVIDWGLAKSLNMDEPDVIAVKKNETNHESPDASKTRHGQLLGTVGFAPPEQLSGEIEQISEKSDVYSLGAILYQILVGHPPIDVAGPKSVAELVKHTIAGNINAPRLKNPKVPPPLSAICMKALSTRSENRYPDVDSFVQDTKCWLADQPVSVLNESVVDRISRYARKHRGAVLASTIGLALIAATSLVSLILVNQARNSEQIQRSKAEQFAEEKTKLAQQKTELANEKTLLANRNQNVVDAFVKAYQSTELENDATTADMSALNVLENAYLEISKEGDSGSVENGLTNATLLDALGSAFKSLGSYDRAQQSFQRALSIRQRLQGQSHVATLASRNQLLATLNANRDVTADDEQFHQTLEVSTQSLGPNHQVTFASMANLAERLALREAFVDSITMFRKLIAARKSTLGEHHVETIDAMGNLAATLHDSGKTDEAIKQMELVLDLRRKYFDESHPRTLTFTANLANYYEAADRIKESIKLHEQVLTAEENKIGAEHPRTLVAMNNYGNVLRQDGQYKKAIGVLRKCLKLREKVLGPDHPYTIGTVNNLAYALKISGDYQEALPLYEQAYQRTLEVMGPEHSQTLTTNNNLAGIYWATGQIDKALPRYEETLILTRKISGPEHPSTLMSMNNLAFVTQRVGKTDEAIKIFEEALRLRKKVSGEDHQFTLSTAHNLASAYEQAGRAKDAVEIHQENLNKYRSKMGDKHPATLSCMSGLASALESWGCLDEALDLFQQTLDLRQQVLGEDHPHTLGNMRLLADAHLANQQYPLAVELFEKTYNLQKSKLGDTHPDTHRTLLEWCNALSFIKKFEIALEKNDQLVRELDAEKKSATLTKAVVAKSAILFGLDRLDAASETANAAKESDKLSELETMRLNTIASVVGFVKDPVQSKMDSMYEAYQALEDKLEELPTYELMYIEQACDQVAKALATTDSANEIDRWNLKLSDVKNRIKQWRNRNLAAIR